jgi:hypothetical protein
LELDRAYDHPGLEPTQVLDPTPVQKSPTQILRPCPYPSTSVGPQERDFFSLPSFPYQ